MAPYSIPPTDRDTVRKRPQIVLGAHRAVHEQMKPNPRIHLIVAVYCATLWATNWCLSTSYDREAGTTYSSVDLRGLGAVVGGIVTVVCGRRLWKLLRELLEIGVRIPAQIRIRGQWRLLLYLAPLEFVLTNSESSIANDGALVSTVFQYGGEPALLSILLAGSAIMLFQTVVNLESLHPSAANNLVHSREACRACE